MPPTHDQLNIPPHDTSPCNIGPIHTKPASPQPVSQIISTQNINLNLDLIHPMVTRFRVGTNRPTQRHNLHVLFVSPLPKSYVDAFNDPNWQNSINNEYNKLIKNNTYTLVPRPAEDNVVHCMWLFRHKYLADETLSRYKIRLVAYGSTQLSCVYIDDTFSPVVKPSTIRMILSLAISWHGPVHQLDVKNAMRKYATKILERAHMSGCNSSRTHVDTESKLSDDGDPVCLYMHDPQEPYFSALKRILWRQPTLSCSNKDEEYRGVTNTIVETCWLRNLLRELHTPLSSATLVYYYRNNPVQHQ
nr:ribonuclease H-like domain-containing protein [Tanacetum cinerariifolium]